MKKNLKILFGAFAVLIAAGLISSCDDAGVITPVGTAGRYVKTYGAGGSDILTTMNNTSDNGLILGGFTISSGAGANDFYATRLSSTNEIVWSKTYGQSGNDVCSSTQETTDGGFILAGSTTSTGSNGSDILLVKTDASGNTVWAFDYVIPGDQYVCSVIQDADQGFIVCGFSDEIPANNFDVIVLKVSSSGQFIFDKLYGGQFNDEAYKMIKASDGGYLIAGQTFNFGAINGDAYLIKLKSDFTLDWSNTYGADGVDQANDVIETSGHDFMVVGNTTSFGLGLGDMLLYKTDHNGIVYTSEGWPRTVGDSSGTDQATSVSQATDGSFFITGYTTNASGNTFISFAHYFNNSVFDFFHSYGGATDNDKGVTILSRSNGFVVGGITASSGVGNNDMITMGLPDSSGTYVSCMTQNTFSPRGGSPTTFSVVTAGTLEHTPSAVTTYTPTLTTLSASTVKAIICGQ